MTILSFRSVPGPSDANRRPKATKPMLKGSTGKVKSGAPRTRGTEVRNRTAEVQHRLPQWLPKGNHQGSPGAHQAPEFSSVGSGASGVRFLNSVRSRDGRSIPRPPGTANSS